MPNKIRSNDDTVKELNKPKKEEQEVKNNIDEKLDLIVGALQNLTAGLGSLINKEQEKTKISAEAAEKARIDKELKELKEAKAKKVLEAKKIVFEEEKSQYNNIQFTDHYFNEQQRAGNNLKNGKLPIIHVP
jgi:hypothetical protein